MDSNDPEGVFERLARLKQPHREALRSLPADVAQAMVDAILHPHLWRVLSPEQLDWPGDLADDADRLRGHSHDERS
jgi:hypothetical protein